MGRQEHKEEGEHSVNLTAAMAGQEQQVAQQVSGFEQHQPKPSTCQLQLRAKQANAQS